MIMSAASTISGQVVRTATRGSSVTFLLRLEGLVAAAASIAVYARTGASWWLFAALFLAPDLSMLGYLSRPCRGARIYNAFHTYVTPATLAVGALLMHAHVAFAVALIWACHIGVDRLFGFGLRYADGFSYTHLGRIGKHSA
jgi:hypothetical protein